MERRRLRPLSRPVDSEPRTRRKPDGSPRTDSGLKPLRRGGANGHNDHEVLRRSDRPIWHGHAGRNRNQSAPAAMTASPAKTSSREGCVIFVRSMRMMGTEERRDSEPATQNKP